MSAVKSTRNIENQHNESVAINEYKEYECVKKNTWEPPIPPELVFTMHPAVIQLAQQRVFEQGTNQWLHARSLRVTASAVGSILNSGWTNFQNPTLPFRQSELVMLRKAGFEEPFTGSDATRHGQALEPEARLVYAQLAKEHLALFGLLVHPQYWFLGASPDGMGLQTGRLLEVKCPKSRTVKPGNPVLAHYWMQCQLQMEVCNVDECYFFEYRIMKRNPKLRTNFVLVTRSREWFDIILPIFQQYVIHLYRMKALANLFKPRWTKTEGYATLNN